MWKKAFLVKKNSGGGVPPTPPQIATNVWIFWAHYAVGKKQTLECKKNLGGEVVPLGEGVLTPNFFIPMSSNFGEICEK